MTLRVFLAGRVAVEVDGRPIDEDQFAGRQGRLVFACLVMEQHRAVPHEELAEAIWGESLPASWRKSLSVIVSKVRALVAECGIDGASALTSAFGCYRLELPPGTWVDVLDAIESVQEAEDALAAGELEAATVAAGRAASLAGQQFMPGEESPWVEAKRRELSDVRSRALTCLADSSLGSGRPDEAARWAEELIALEPFRETGYRRLMDVHAAAGNRAEALRVYERCRVLLAAELGAYPSPETESIYRGLLNGSDSDSALEREQVPGTVPLQPASSSVNGGSAVAERSKPGRLRFAAFSGAVVVAASLIGVIAIALRDEATPALARVHDNAVAVVDARSRSILAEATEIASPQRVVSGDGAIWVTSSSGGGSLVRLDPESHAVVDSIDVGNGPLGVAVGAGAVWVANSLDGTVSRIDPATGREAGDPIDVGNTPTGVAFGGGAVWVTNTDDRSLSRIDPVTGTVRMTDVDAAARWVAVGGGAVWVTDPVGNKLVRIDAHSGIPTDQVGVGSGPTAVAYHAGAVWVTNSLDGTLSRVDPRRMTVTNVIPVGVAPNGIAVGTDGVWVTDEVGGALVHLDRTSGKPTVTRLGGRPEGVAVAADGSLWIAVQAAGASHRGGTLRLFGDLDFVDPARAYYLDASTILSAVFDGLVSYKKVGGVEGNMLVPDLARAVPTPADNGKTYTFRLRDGIRFADGRALKASDVRASLERLFKAHTPRPEFYEGIRGGTACRKQPTHCSLSNGVLTNDATGIVTIRLRAPDKDFLYKLALPFASVLPAGTPITDTGRIPGTGPYRIAQYEPHVRLHLVRNRQFDLWSRPAQPEGVPDEIVFDLAETDGDAGLTAVKRGREDISYVPPNRLEEVRAHHASQLHVTPRADVFMLDLNTQRPPFDDPRARRAVAFAFDRARLVDALGGSDVAAPTCQLLPPNFTGYRRYCPYTIGATKRGDWTAPDLETARKLVAQSGTKGMRVDVLGLPAGEGAFGALTTVLTKTLTQLGYETSVRRLRTVGSYLTAVNAGVPRAQAAFHGMFPDYPTPAGFLTQLVTCDGAPYACNDPFVRQLRRRVELETRTPQGADDAWIRLERELVGKAIVVPVVTGNAIDFVSRRVGNYQRHPVYGILISQLWVK